MLPTEKHRHPLHSDRLQRISMDLWIENVPSRQLMKSQNICYHLVHRRCFNQEGQSVVAWWCTLQGKTKASETFRVFLPVEGTHQIERCQLGTENQWQPHYILEDSGERFLPVFYHRSWLQVIFAHDRVSGLCLKGGTRQSKLEYTSYLKKDLRWIPILPSYFLALEITAWSSGRSQYQQ